MPDLTPAQILDLPLGDNAASDSGAPTVRGYLVALLAGVWRDGECFDGKRPFGNSGWECDLHAALFTAGLIEGNFMMDEHDCDAGNQVIDHAIQALGGAA